jgi:acetyl esterase/lipase
VRALVLAAVCACNGTMERYFAGDIAETFDDQVYVAGSTNPRQRLDLVVPRGASGVPVVVFVHGGFWIHQDKNYFAPFVGLYHNVGIALARRGIATAVIDYRLAPEVMFEQQLDDVAAAVRWVHDHVAEHGGDPQRMVIAGHSAGGHIAALLAFDDGRLTSRGVDTSAIRGYVPLSPILDLPAMAAADPDDAAIAAEVFGTALVAESPVTYLSPATAPILLVMGSADLDIVLAQVPPAVATLAAMNAPVQFHELPGKTHDDIVVDFDTDADAVTPLVAPFVEAL